MRKKIPGMHPLLPPKTCIVVHTVPSVQLVGVVVVGAFKLYDTDIEGNG